MNRLFSFLVLIFALASCGRERVPDSIIENNSYSFKAGEASTTLTKAQEAMVVASNDFGFKVASRIKEKSFIFSPLSASILLGMLGEGAEGETAAQISRVLGFGDAGRQQVNEFSRNMMVIADNSSEAVVRIANAIVLNKGYTLKDSFIKAVREYYDAKAVTMDFANPATLRYINGWASEKTNGLIPELLKEVDPGAFSYLMDALYFKGAWTDEFQQWKQDADFFKEDGSTSKVNMLNSLIREYPYCKTTVAQAVALDYKGGNYRMTLVLPSEGNNVSDVLSALGEGLWKDISSALSGAPAILYMPSFETASDVPLKDILKSMGMTAAFGAADFSRMTDFSVAVDDIFQKAKIKVDRYGTEAAAVTVAVVKETAFPIMDEPLKIVADHPFIYLITERTTGALLFVGVFAG